jgi:hypothetical protein
MMVLLVDWRKSRVTECSLVDDDESFISSPVLRYVFVHFAVPARELKAARTMNLIGNELYAHSWYSQAKARK